MALDWSWRTDERRLAYVESLDLEALGRSPELARLTLIAQLVTGAAFSQISIIGQHQQVPASSGFRADVAASTPADDSLCAVTMAVGGVLWVEDAAADELVRDLAPVASGEIGSYLGVPLVTGAGLVIGALCVFDPAAREWSDTSDEVLHELAAIAIREIEQQADLDAQASMIGEMAATLQELVLPAVLPAVPQVELAAQYRPASHGLMLGGDWYDAFHVDDDRIALAVGDVAGHGLPAASLMAQLRSALRAYAVDGPRPGQLLLQLDRLLLELAPETIAAAAFGELRLSSGELVYASRGLIPPLYVTRAGAAYLAVPEAPPLNADPDGRADATDAVRVRLEPGDYVVIFTDGLVERRGIDIGEQLEELRLVAASLERSLSARDVCDRFVERMVGDTAEDDVCVLVARTVEPGGG